MSRPPSDPTLHADARRMGSGAIPVTTPAGTRRFIVEAGPALDQLDALVRLISAT